MPLYLELKIGESVIFGTPQVQITLKEKNGQRARLEIEADKSVSIRHQKEGGASMAANGITKTGLTESEKSLRVVAKTPA